ncbi:hypothetical protein F5883DRAFT_146023 [Diaporthe sp. PMI_573]|nr:hypothetical protein F5883DRAFT_146023 [Diaporthaceae sp. PMI_573]
MGRQYDRQHESWGRGSGHIGIEFGNYPRRSSSKRRARSRSRSTEGCCTGLGRRRHILIPRGIEFIFVGTALGTTVARLVKPPVPAYPPGGTGDHGTLPFIIVAGILGIVSVIFGLFSQCNCFNKIAEKGHKCRFFRYISLCLDFIYAAIAGGAMTHAVINLGEGGTQCFANMGTYQGCAILMGAAVLTGLGALMALICFILELCRIKKWKNTSTGD